VTWEAPNGTRRSPKRTPQFPFILSGSVSLVPCRRSESGAEIVRGLFRLCLTGRAVLFGEPDSGALKLFLHLLDVAGLDIGSG